MGKDTGFADIQVIQLNMISLSEWGFKSAFSFTHKSSGFTMANRFKGLCYTFRTNCLVAH